MGLGMSVPLRLLDGSQLTSLPPLSLYVHLPWCIRKCPYCDFNSHATPKADLPEQSYLAALMADLEAALPNIWGRRIQTIFIGGGTPSLFSPAAIAQLLTDIKARLPVNAGAEITLEANPGTFEKDRFRGFRQAGVTRLSIGVQSFDNDKLQALGRIHSSDQACAAIEEAKQCFDTFNLDLMYGLPKQTLADLQQDLHTALSFEPPHLSLYHLTIEANTAFANSPPANLPDDDTISDMMDLLREQTVAAGLDRYEVSACARQGHRCQHNLNYWMFGDYLGIGAGAHSKLSFPDRIERQVRWREPASYMREAMAGRAMSNQHLVSAKERPFEFMLNALRLTGGFDMHNFTECTGLAWHTIQAHVDKAEQQGLLTRDLYRIKPTEKGLDFLSDLQALFLTETSD
jgi:putative oxygen-independent coproporphyrinogen III oxidase